MPISVKWFGSSSQLLLLLLDFSTRFYEFHMFAYKIKLADYALIISVEKYDMGWSKCIRREDDENRQRNIK